MGNTTQADTEGKRNWKLIKSTRKKFRVLSLFCFYYLLILLRRGTLFSGILISSSLLSGTNRSQIVLSHFCVYDLLILWRRGPLFSGLLISSSLLSGTNRSQTVLSNFGFYNLLILRRGPLFVCLLISTSLLLWTSIAYCISKSCQFGLYYLLILWRRGPLFASLLISALLSGTNRSQTNCLPTHIYTWLHSGQTFACYICLTIFHKKRKNESAYQYHHTVSSGIEIFFHRWWHSLVTLFFDSGALNIM
jgi:hypothetical protein